MASVGAPAYLARAEWRSRRSSVLALAVVAGLAAAVAMGAFAAARRGPDAFERLIAGFEDQDGSVGLTEDATPADIVELDRLVATDPDVDHWGAVAFSFLATPDGTYFGGFAPIADGGIGHPAVVRGRLPDADEPYELVLTTPTARALQMHVGDTVDIGVYGLEQTNPLANGDLDDPAHGVHTFTVVGEIVRPFDLGFDTDEENDVMWSLGLWAALDGDLPIYGAGAGYTLRPGARAEDVNERVTAAMGPSVFTVVGSDQDADVAKVAQSIDQQSNTLRAFVVVVAVSAAILLAQAVRRQLAGGLLSQSTLGAVGIGPSGRRLAALLWAVPFAIVAAVIAGLGAVLLSPVGPVGVARDAELDQGIRLDATVLLLGLLAVVTVIVGAGLLHGASTPSAGGATAWRRPSRLTGVAPSAATAIGVYLASSHGRSRSRTRTSLGAIALAATVVAAVAAFGASLDRATTSPDAYGWTFDASVAECADSACSDAAAARLDRIEGVAAYSGVATTTDGVIVGLDHQVEAAVVDVSGGWAAGRILAGRAPAADDEVVLGPGTASEAGLAVGDTVDIAVGGGIPAPFTVVGLFDPPTAFFDDSVVDEGMAATRGGAERVVDPELIGDFDNAIASQWQLLELAPGADRAAVLAELDQAFPGTLRLPFRPDRLEAAFRLRSLPVLLAALLAALGLGGLLHVAAISAVRRRSVLATLQALGFRRSQIRAAVTTELVVVTTAVTVVATPVGAALGRIAWRATARGLGSTAAPIVPVATLVALVGATVAVALAIGALAGTIGARARPAAGLRT